MKLPLTLGCGIYDRTFALRDGTVTPEGVELNCPPVSMLDLFWRQARHAEFDASEFSLSTLMILHSRGDDRLVAIPVFPSRVFRHGFIFVNARSGIRRPQDLIGKRVGSYQYQQTAALWIRAILQHEYGVAPHQVEWYLGGLDTPGYSEKIPLEFPANLTVHVIEPHLSLDQLLEQGAIDAFIGASEPQSFTRGSKRIRRLFPNYRRVEAEYFRRTGFFPIMHTVVLRRDIYEKARWVAMSLYQAFVEAKKLAMQRLEFTGYLHCMMPWQWKHLEETRAVMGRDYWPYGLAANRRILEAMAEYSLEQGLIKRPIDVEELFVPETRAT